MLHFGPERAGAQAFLPRFFGWETQLPQDSVSVCSPASGIFSRRRWRSPGWRRRSAMSTRRARVVNGRSPSAAGAHGLATGRRSAFDLPRKGHLYSCRCRSTSAPRLLPPASGHLPRSCCLTRWQRSEHAPGIVRGVRGVRGVPAAPLAGEGGQEIVPAWSAPGTGKAMGKKTTTVGPYDIRGSSPVIETFSRSDPDGRLSAGPGSHA
jgi:hypothetical protein